ncbi:unnamed protein product [Dovyalis caffra]|uniref:non-specific serine/threonine protein kinase n=1 Tax=Dovyalis caffra TaxID=77055 RepID=A0AAV1SLF1_9ROSI|nr:unnamed protein product [Dovyalis caffra]
MEIDAEVKDSSLILIKQGAEARVFESNFVGRRSVIKERFSKKYRHPTLDSKLTLKRLNAEARCMTKARRQGVSTPVLYAVDPLLHALTFEYVDGPSVKDVFLEFGLHGVVEERLDDIAMQIGDSIGKLHDGGLIHGDLTTSNMLIRTGTNQLVLIDFGLSFTSTLPEDKAVDLYVLERALLSMHSSCGNVMDRILAGYRKSSKQWSSTLNKLAQVRQRGRKRTMIETFALRKSYGVLIVAVTAGASASTSIHFEHGGQVGMVVEMYINSVGFFTLLEESIESTIQERDLKKRKEGELFKMNVALKLGRSLSQQRTCKKILYFS